MGTAVGNDGGFFCAATAQRRSGAEEFGIGICSLSKS